MIAGAILIGLVLAVLVLEGRSLYSRAIYGTWDPSALPTRIDYCDRRYYPASPPTQVTQNSVDQTGNAFGAFPIRQIGATLAGKPIVAKPLPETVRRQFPNGPILPCTMVVYVKVGANEYVPYGIAGGP
ncbi:MAG TPA: hypothetical protein VIT43_08810 [Candidatus Dormibacteraeota bacterium]